ncbi:MAG: acylphosphatase [Spirochaetes bacterium]|nr:acylphosphatase [Spirochaetota bacterium]
MLRANVTLSGRVQGVGFRYFVMETAKDMQLFGEVWNNYDGTVEIDVFCETKDILDRFLVRIKKGPALSNVNEMNIVVRPSDPPATESFTIRQ